MGATLSYLGYLSQQRPNPPSHDHVFQQLHRGSLGGPTLILSNEDAGSIAELYTRLGALEKDLQISRAENTRKDAVIQYLLQYNISNVPVKEIIVNLNGQVLTLETTINQTNKENKEIKVKLSKAEDTISRLQSAPTSFSSRSDIPPEIDLVAEDLIDLLDSSHESDSAKLMKEDTALLDDSFEHESGIEGEFMNTTPDQSLHQSPYIVYFADSEENAEAQAAVNLPTNETRVPWGTPDSVTPLSELCTDVAVLTDFGDSLPPSCPAPTSTSFITPANSVTQLPEKFNVSAIEPRWIMSETFDSSEERESAASINRRHGGPDELPYPDLFKYGVHFSPPDSEDDIYRTIIISNIPPDISLSTLLDYIRGGSVIDAKLLDTVSITGKNSALITFLHECAAMAFEDHARKFPIIINGVAAQVRVVSTPTFPISIPTRKRIFNHHHSRCLEIYDIPGQICVQKLRDDLAVGTNLKTNRITHLQKREDGCVELQFSSIDGASRAYGMLSSVRAYRRSTPYFVADPCARPLKSLKGQHVACTVNTEMVNRISIGMASDAEPAARDSSGRLAKVEWESDPKLCRGRGFATGS